MKKLLFIGIALFLLFAPFIKAQAKENIPIVYFSTPGCEECIITRNYLDALKEIYSYINVQEFPVSDPKNKELLAHFGNLYNLPDNKINVTPAVFIGKRAFVSEETLKGLDKVIENYDYSETKFINSVLANETSSNGLVEIFKKFGVFTVLGAGLIDGYNPCAFTVLIFFISLLLIRKRSKKDILFVGLAFTIGLGLSYFLLGTGLFSVISKWKYFDEISKWVYLITAIVTLVFAVLTFQDYLKAKKGITKDMALQLSTTEKRTIHSLLRNPKVQSFTIFSFLVAFPVSIVEFSCTGQTYLPTIIYIYSMPSLRLKAFLYLVLYNIMFILPCLVIVFFAYRGSTSEKFSNWFTAHLATIKLLTGIVFIALFAYLAERTLLLFGLIH
jgi:cytochrome c biogenesis protein CcdA